MQKVLRIVSEKYKEIDKYLDKGWRICHISACSGKGELGITYAYVVLEIDEGI